jgi:hypothetical protein
MLKMTDPQKQLLFVVIVLQIDLTLMFINNIKKYSDFGN